MLNLDGLKKKKKKVLAWSLKNVLCCVWKLNIRKRNVVYSLFNA